MPKRLGQWPVVEDKFMPACAEEAVQGLVPCFPEHCKGVAQDARVQAAGVRMTCCFRDVSPRLQPVRMWPLVGFEFTDGRAECLRVTGDNQRRSPTPSAAQAATVVSSAQAGTRAASAGGQWRLAAAGEAKQFCRRTHPRGRGRECGPGAHIRDRLPGSLLDGR